MCRFYGFWKIKENQNQLRPSWSQQLIIEFWGPFFGQSGCLDWQKIEWRASLTGEDSGKQRGDGGSFQSRCSLKQWSYCTKKTRLKVRISHHVIFPISNNCLMVFLWTVGTIGLFWSRLDVTLQCSRNALSIRWDYISTSEKWQFIKQLPPD